MSPRRKHPLERMQELTVGDVMTRDVAAISSSARMDEAARVLVAQHASGAPVVDEAGRCVGVLSAADFLRLTDRQTECGDGPPPELKNLPNDGLTRQALPWNSVARFMSSAVQTISPSASLLEASEILCARHIHRLVALDERAAPAGVISTLDIVAALVSAIEEHRQWLSLTGEHGP